MAVAYRAVHRVTTLTKRRLSIFAVTALVAAVLCASCSRGDPEVASGTSDFRLIATEFAEALAARDYPTAYAMTSLGYRQRSSVEQLRREFEAIVPTDWGAIGPIEVGQAMSRWPGRQPSDLGWVYVSIGGDVYSEAIVVVVTSENGEAKIREIEFGRP